VTDLLERVPVIRRAREYHLYSLSGTRYLDLWQNGGRSLLGHRPAGLTTVLKNTISKGLAADLPSIYSGRVRRLLEEMFPEYKDFRLTGSAAEGLQFASLYLKRNISANDLVDPLTEQGESAAGKVGLWRPMLPDTILREVLFPILPFSMAGAPAAVCFRKIPPSGFPGQKPISAVVLAGLLRCLQDLRRFVLPQWFRPDLLDTCPGWRQKGIYLIPGFGMKLYEKVFEGFLEAGVLLNPVAPYVSILPVGEISEGELRKMIGLFFAFPGK
jgi:hypothetical protein